MRRSLYALVDRDRRYLAEDGSITDSPSAAMKRDTRRALFEAAEKVGARIEQFTVTRVRG